MSLPLVTRFGANPLLDLELANKNYVDSAGGGGLTHARIVKSVDQVINNQTTFENDDEIFFSVAANREYGFFLSIFYTASAAADFKYIWSVPAGMDGELALGSWFADADRNTQDVFDQIFVSTNNSLIRGLECTGNFLTGATAGTAQLQWAQFAAIAENCTLHAGSFVIIWENA